MLLFFFTRLGSVQAGLERNASLGQALYRELSRQSESGAAAAEQKERGKKEGVVGLGGCANDKYVTLGRTITSRDYSFKTQFDVFKAPFFKLCNLFKRFLFLFLY